MITFAALTQSQGFYLRDYNFVKKLPLFCAKLYPQENWYERDVYFTTADKGEEYVKDREFLKSCLIFTCLSQRNKCRTFIAKNTTNYNNEIGQQDNNIGVNLNEEEHFYKNELTLLQDTKADIEYKKFEKENLINDFDLKLLNCFDNILKEIKNDADYKKDWSYGTYQIIQEFNKIMVNGNVLTLEEFKELKEKDKKILKKIVNYDTKPHNKNLDNLLNSLKTMLKDYYKEQIQDKLFEYELLK